MSKVIDDILAERAAQDAQWGGPAHDDEHSMIDWLNYISYQLRHAGYAAYDEVIPAYRQRLVKTAALAAAAIESLDRKTKS